MDDFGKHVLLIGEKLEEKSIFMLPGVENQTGEKLAYYGYDKVL
jgi:hypothetical protein